MVDPAAPEGSGVACCPRTPITVVLAKLEFMDDHGMLKDAWKGADGKYEWRDTGSLFSHPDWERTHGSKPNTVSYSMVKSLDLDKRDPVSGSKAKIPNREKTKIKIYLSVTGDNCSCPDKCLIRGLMKNTKGKRVALFQSGWITLKPSATLRDLEMDAKHVLPRRIMRRKLTIDWVIRSSKKSSNRAFPKTTRFARTSNECLITLHTPLLKSQSKEKGVTLARMSRSIDWVGNPKTTDHRKIINHLFGKFDAYTLVELEPKTGGYEIKYSNLTRDEKKQLKSRPKLLKRLGDLGWSGYFKAPGAWPAADPQLVRWGAECQAICRLVMGMLHQLGSDADIELVYAWADFGNPDKAVVKSVDDLDKETAAGKCLDSSGNATVAPSSYCKPGRAKPTGPNATRGYVMVDAAVQKGKLYIPPVLDPKDGKRKIPSGHGYRNSNSIGWNSFEAYARYRYKTLKGKRRERFYGGGVGEHSGHLVRDIFQGIAEYELRTVTVWGQSVEGRYITGYYDYGKRKYM